MSKMSMKVDEDVSPPLFEKRFYKSYLQRTTDITILLLLVSLLWYRLVSLTSSQGDCEPREAVTWLVAMACEAWFAFVWVIVVSTKWTRLHYLTYPQRLLLRKNRELPRLDIFVTTADPELEPPILTVNTVLSLMSLDYPRATNKLAVYVSDDACSPLVFFALLETSKFAQLWIPFCRKYDIQVRAPFRYFVPTVDMQTPSSNGNSSGSIEFQHDWKLVKKEYEKLSRKIEEASRKPASNILSPSDFATFVNIERSNHPPIVKIISENKEATSDGLPHLIYISREKRPKHHHNYKAGAMNTLIRVSGLVTNAPYILNVDCDMFANNPQIALHALSILMDQRSQDDTAFVQCPQKFYDGLKDDPFGNQLQVAYEYIGRGMVSIQGPVYAGTGCIHCRKVLYGALPKNAVSRKKMLSSSVVDLSAVEKLNEFGSSGEFLKSVTEALNGKSNTDKELSSSLEAVHHVARCDYEYGTSWGKKFGIIYGSTTEDVLTGLTIHSRGWRSAYSAPDQPGFMGCAPSAGPASLNQMKRWSTGLLEVALSRSNPIMGTLFGGLRFRECLAYTWILTWNVRSIPELIYAFLPAYCIITNSHFLPKKSAELIPASMFAIYNIYTLLEYLSIGLSVRAWWNNQRMARITSASAWLFGVLGVALKLMGISETVFEVTKKEQSNSDDQPDEGLGRFTFDKSPIFVPGTTLILVQLAALSMLVLGMQPVPSRGGSSGLAELVCCLWVVFLFWPFLRGLLGKGKYGIPLKTIYKSATLATVFLLFCRFSSRQARP